MSKPDKPIRDRDLLQRGAAVSRVVALSAEHSLPANDPIGFDRLVSETKASDPNVAFVSILDAPDCWWKAEEILDAAFARGSAPAHP